MKTFLPHTYIVFLLFINLIFSQQFTEQNVIDFSKLHTNTGNAVADYDLDGDLDLFVVANKSFTQSDETTWSRLFNNNRGRFEDVTEASGFSKQHSSFSKLDSKLGASWGDYDNDGYPDILLTHQDGIQLYQNMQNGTFKDVTDTSGIEPCVNCNNTNGIWWDYDNDGDLDLYLNYLDIPNRLYNNNGDGTFKEIEGALNLNDKSRTWSSLPIDVNLDGWTDLYVVNDFGLSKFYINNNGTSFTEATDLYQLENKGCGMGSTIGDYNNDGIFDIYVTNIAADKANPLFKGNAMEAFENKTTEEGVGDGDFGWGTKFLDADNDGDQDLYIVNGNESLNYNNVFFKNLRSEGEDRFVNWSQQSQANGFANGMGTEVFDYDNDGDLDIFVCNTNDSPYLYRNNFAPNTWVQIDLEGVQSNRNGFGATVTVSVAEKHLHRLHHGSNMMGQSIKPVHFGLGKAQKIDSLQVTWTNGRKDIIYNIEVNQKIKIVELQGMVEGKTFTQEETQEEEPNNDTDDIQNNVNNTNLTINTIPNPFSDFIDFHINLNTVNSSDYTIQIYSINGIKVEEITGQIPTDEKDLTKRWFPKNLKLSPGIYLYNINCNNEIKMGKIVFTP